MRGSRIVGPRSRTALESDSLVHCGNFMSLWESEMRNAMLCKAGT